VRIRAIFRCPFCSRAIANKHLTPQGPIICPNCSEQLRHSRWQLRLSGLLALGLTIALCWTFGIRGLWLFVVAILLWFPVYLLSDVAFVRIVPPKLERY
jgi:hypothetical protein